LADVSHCVYSDLSCALEDGGRLVWKVVEHALDKFVPLRIFEGQYNRHRKLFIASSKEFALSFPPSPQIIKNRKEKIGSQIKATELKTVNIFV
jgi:hypothetical protein